MLQISNEVDKYDGNYDRAYSSFTLDVIDCTKYISDTFKFRKRIVSENHTIIAVVKGAVRINERDTVSRGGLVLLPTFSNAELEAEEKSEFIQIAFRLYGLKAAFPKKTTAITVDFDIYSRVEHLYRTVNFHNSIEGVKEAILLDIINELSKYLTTAYNEINIYQKICHWIEANSERNISAQDVANALGYSREHLNRIVKSFDNERLGDKIVKYRIENIKMLCGVENLSIAEIAERLGFYSRELLCKYFKYHTGTSINDYRKKRI